MSSKGMPASSSAKPSSPNIVVLYNKLHAKYRKLKNETDSEMEKLNSDQEDKFMNYSRAADEIIQCLNSTNEKLRGQVDELQSELASIRSSNERDSQYQKLWEEENQKNKELSEEISRLQKLERGECTRRILHEGSRSEQDNSHENTLSEGTPGKTLRNLTKKRKSMHTIKGAASAYIDVRSDHAEHQHVYGNEDRGASSSTQQPMCCQKKISGDGSTNSSNCVFQYLIEFLIGMKITPLAASNELSILAHHQSSGYSFSLTWITNSRGETELLYRVLSLGTFERIAPEWMKETIMFSTSMCRIFFDRLSRVMKS